MKPLTINELKTLQIGDWVWIVDLESPKHGSGYWKIHGFAKTHIHFNQESALSIMPEALYGTKWLAYKNKEQAEAKGEIVELPCKIGDMAYELWQDNDGLYHIDENEVTDFEIDYDYDIEIVTGIWYEHYFGTFLTRAEAERRLAELKGDLQ